MIFMMRRRFKRGKNVRRMFGECSRGIEEEKKKIKNLVYKEKQNIKNNKLSFFFCFCFIHFVSFILFLLAGI